MGITQGDRIVLHSSLSSLGWVDGGAETVVQAFADVLGADGLLMAPTFNTQHDGIFDRSVPTNTGKTCQAVIDWPGSVRSCCPTHSVAAIGNDAEGFCADHHLVEPTGIGSPLDKVAQADGCVMLLGVLHNRNTTIHIGEAHAHVPYLSVQFDPDRPVTYRLKLWDGSVIEKTYKEFPGCSTAFGAVESAMRRHSKIADYRLGNSRIQLMRGLDLIDTVREMMTERIDWLLCTDPDCTACPPRRQLLRDHGHVA
jgi:aminoglycoside 3-N-acetyltransferase